MITHSGGCHCGLVRFEVVAPAHLTVALTTYTFNTHTARHMFCSRCGIKAFYVPRSHPDGFSVNANCIDSDTVEGITVRDTDGRNWEATHGSGVWTYDGP